MTRLEISGLEVAQQLFAYDLTEHLGLHIADRFEFVGHVRFRRRRRQQQVSESENFNASVRFRVAASAATLVVGDLWPGQISSGEM